MTTAIPFTLKPTQRCGASVIPAQAGIHDVRRRLVGRWIPACAGITEYKPQARCSSRIKPTAIALLKLLCVLLPLAILPGVARAATITLVDEKLNLQAIGLQSMDEQTISFFDEKGNYQTRSIDNFLQLRLTMDPSSEPTKVQAASQANSQTTSQNGTTNNQAGQVPAQDAQDAQDQNAPNPNNNNQNAEQQTPALPQGWGIVELIDGQRLTGRFIGNDDTGQLMQWEHPQAGMLTFKLDHVRQWRMNPSPLPEVANDGSDRLYLANGDALLGFVSSITTSAVSFVPQGAQEPVAIDLVRVKALRLANAPVSQIKPTSLVVLDDQTRLRATRVVIERGELRFTPTLRQSEQWVTLPLSSLRRLDFANERWELSPWSSLQRTIKEGGMVFAAPWPVRQTDEALHLHAPSTITFALPAGVVAIAATAGLDVPSADPAIGWADFVVNLHIDDPANSAAAANVELARLAINDTQPQGRLHADLTQTSQLARPRTLTLTLDPALNGPIMDRLKLTDAWLVIARPEAR